MLLYNYIVKKQIKKLVIIQMSSSIRTENPKSVMIKPISLPSLSSSILFAKKEPDIAPINAPIPANIATDVTSSPLRPWAIAPDPAIKNIIRRDVPIAV